MSQPILSVRGAEKSLGGNPILNGVDLDLYCGQVCAVLGPSGAGKSTLLRTIAGLEALEAGSIVSGGQSWDDGKHLTPAEKRRVGVVFQDYALFPHLTVEKNIAFGLKGHFSKDAVNARVAELTKQTEISALSQSYPHELSGGEQQRVALARALAPRPDIILLDEPFSSLDRRLRADLREQTMKVIREAGAAALIVTHDADEAFETADTLFLMEEGRIIQSGSPAEVYCHPVSISSARLLGDINVAPGRIENHRIETLFGTIKAPDIKDGTAMNLLVRPEALRESETGAEFTVEDIRIRQGRQRIRITASDGTHWIAELPLANPIKKGGILRLALDESAMTLLPAL
ncbi:MAG: ABC transporter ATP-binding protein [Rhodobacterales bacterium CG15_BIG_FIL_POST_REV_8_21_14_020_59_13]|nr:MAG: ABC transporter ATP-binding protein [Rhodobacterales bacterium CG15_BIG_FIL_POST_REV_8_21_14_020_59_13]